MHEIPYLTARRGVFYFRRRVPGFSTNLSPVMLSMRTTDRRAAHRLCLQLTALMDRMIAADTYTHLSDAEVTAFFQAELRRELDALRASRLVERMDGSLTAERATAHRLEAYVLRSLVEDGLREIIPEDRIAILPEREKHVASKIHAELFRKFISPSFNQGVLRRAEPSRGHQALSEYEKLRLRWAAVEARMAAHDALERVPLHQAEAACREAEDLLRKLTGQSSTAPDCEAKQQKTSPAEGRVPTSTAEIAPGSPEAALSDQPHLTPGVNLIKGRITAEKIYAQRDAALDQPEDPGFDGEAASAIIDRTFGEDLFGTTVRMCRKQQTRPGTKEQKLKTVSLFIFTTGIQLVTDIRTHHIDMFADALKSKLPKSYWKSPRERGLTFTESRSENHAALPNTIGLSRSSIDRHLTTMKSIMAHAVREGHEVSFNHKISELLPVDHRSDAEKRSVFTLEDVQMMFSQPLWSGSKSKKRRHETGPVVFKDHHYWINIALALSGARRGEIAGLLTTDILEEDGIQFAYIRANHLRGLKKSHCKRRVPLHPQLIELGFLDFVEEVRQSGRTALFPEAIPARSRAFADNIGGGYASYDDKFGDALDHVWRQNLTRAFPGNPKGYTLHSLRHYANDTLINLRGEDGMRQLVTDIDRRDLMGHKPIDVNEGTYRRDEKPLRPLFEAIKLLPRLRCLDGD